MYFLQRNRAVSEVASMASRHRRRSVPSFPGFPGRGWRANSVDQNLLEGFQSDGGEKRFEPGLVSHAWCIGTLTVHIRQNN